jgi:F0F1-type ATP synthase membrane subunit b/b'
MPGAGRAEVYFIVAMMVLIIVVCVVVVTFFFKTYKKEMKEKELRIQAKLLATEEKKDAAS